MKLAPLACIVSALALSACSEARSDDGGHGGGGATAGTGGPASEGGSAPEGGHASGGADDDGGGTSAPGDLAINEISLAEDWIELTNTGSAPFDLSGVMLADAAEPGTPKTSDGIVFPEGTSLAPGAFMFILAKQDSVDPGEQTPQTVCEPGPSPCFYAPFGLSGADGDELFLLDDDDVIATAEVPGDAVGDSESYCRRPDGLGDFEACEPTPGAPNR